MTNSKRTVKSSQQKVKHDSPVVMNFGTRKISDQNFSKMIALPKTALANCSPEEIARVNVQLVQDNGEKYIKLTPVSQTEKDGDRT